MEIKNGVTSWTITGSLATARSALGGTGTQTSALASGGATTVALNNTEEFTDPTFAVQKITTS